MNFGLIPCDPCLSPRPTQPPTPFEIPLVEFYQRWRGQSGGRPYGGILFLLPGGKSYGKIQASGRFGPKAGDIHENGPPDSGCRQSSDSRRVPWEYRFQDQESEKQNAEGIDSSIFGSSTPCRPRPGPGGAAIERSMIKDGEGVGKVFSRSKGGGHSQPKGFFFP